MTVQHLVDGHQKPLSITEFLQWCAFFQVEADLIRESQRKKGGR